MPDPNNAASGRTGVEAQADNTLHSTPRQSPAQDAPRTEEIEGKLRCERSALEAILETTDAKLVYLDRDFNFVKVNRAYADTCKMRPEDMVGRNHFELYPNEENERIFRQARDTGEAVFFKDKPFVFPDQPERGVTYWDWSLVPVKGKSNEVIGLVFSLCETTDKKNTEESIRRSELHLRLALDAAFLMMFEWDIKRDELHRYVTNHTIVSSTADGAPERFQDFYELVHPEDRDIFLEGLQRAKSCEDGLYESEFRIVGKDGRVAWLHENGRVERDPNGQPARLIGLSQDITERKTAEAALRASEEEFRAMFEITSVGKAVADCATRRLLRVNDALCALTGYTSAELLGMTVDDLDYPEERERDRQLFARLTCRESDRFEAEQRYVRKDGSAIWVHVSGNVIRAPEGQPLRAVAVIQDITHQKELQTELERLVVARTAKLHELVGELEHFSYTITHDMRAPLRAMRGFAEVLCDTCGGTPHPEMKTYLARIISSAERMDTLITDALSYSKAVRQDLQLVPVETDKLLREMLDTYPEFLAHRESIRVEGKIPCVVANEAGLIQCFSNLVTNALKFVATGKEPEVCIWGESIKRTAGTQGDGSGAGWVRIWIEDKGIGISQHMLPRVFDMFSRGAGDFTGTGIGLALVRKVAYRMGGQVGVESEPGKGSRFWMEFRACEQPEFLKPGKITG